MTRERILEDALREVDDIACVTGEAIDAAVDSLNTALALLSPPTNTDTPQSPLKYITPLEAIRDAIDTHLRRARARVYQISCTAPHGYNGTCYCEPECHGPTCPKWGKDGWGWQDHVRHNPSSHEDE